MLLKKVQLTEKQKQAEAKLEEKEQAKKQVKDEQAANKARIDSAKITTPAPAATFKIKRN